MIIHKAVFGLLLTILTASVGADMTQCYNCTYSRAVGADGEECISSPSTVQNCTNANQCYTESTVNIVTGEVTSVVRGCDEGDEAKSTGCTSESVHKTCTTVCNNSSLCNSKNESSIPKPYVKCYSCEYNYHPATNDTCVQIPTSQREVRCYSPATCYTRANYLKGEERMNSFSRGCADVSNQRKQCVESAEFRDCLAVCCEDHCNTGDGTKGTFHPSCLSPTMAAPYPTGPDPPSSATSFTGLWYLLIVIVPLSWAGELHY